MPLRCTLSRRTFSAIASPVPGMVFYAHRNYSSTQSICDRSDPQFQDCCVIDRLQVLTHDKFSELEQLRIRWLQPLATIFWNHSLFLHDFFVESLNLTMSTLDASFQSSYGYNYQRNKDFFVRFFDNLQSYMLGKRQNLSILVDNFFHELLIRIVRLMLFAKSEHDLMTADCISSELEKNKPFGRIPEGIKRMAIRAFPPARITANALLIGSETIWGILKEMKFTSACHIDWIKLRYCSFCFGEVDTFICPESCHHRIGACMTDYAALNEPWTQFIDHLLALIERLGDSHSFPQVNRPLQIHITDAIMSFQRLFSHIDPSLLRNCSYQEMHPVEGRMRQKRQLSYFHGGVGFPSIPETVDYFKSLPSLDNQTRIMRDQYLPLRSLFANFEEVFCSPDLLRYSNHSVNLNNQCWDGVRVSSAGNVLGKPSPSPATSNPVVRRLTQRLHEITRMLQSILHSNADPDFLSTSDVLFINSSDLFTNPAARNSLAKANVYGSSHMNKLTESSVEASYPQRHIDAQPTHLAPSPSTSIPVESIDSEGSGFSPFTSNGLIEPPTAILPTDPDPSPTKLSSFSSGISWDDEDYPPKYPAYEYQFYGHFPAEDKFYVNPLLNSAHKYEMTTAKQSNPGQQSHRTSITPQFIPEPPLESARKLPPHPTSHYRARPAFFNAPNQLWIPQTHQKQSNRRWSNGIHHGSPSQSATWSCVALNPTVVFSLLCTITYASNIVTL